MSKNIIFFFSIPFDSFRQSAFESRLDIYESSHGVIRIAAENVSIDLSISFGSGLQLLPCTIFIKFICLTLPDSKMFFEKIDSKTFNVRIVMLFTQRNIIVATILFNYNSNFRIPIAQQTAIVDVRTADNKFFVVYYHQLGVNVQDLGDGNISDDPVLTQAKELYVVADLSLRYSAVKQNSKKRCIRTTNGLIFQMKLNPHHCRVAFPNVSLEAWQQRNEDHHFKILLQFIGQKDSFGQLCNHQVLSSNEKLIFNVDEAFSFSDEV